MYNEEIQEEESDENQDQVEGEIRCVCGSVDDDGASGSNHRYFSF